MRPFWLKGRGKDGGVELGSPSKKRPSRDCDLSTELLVLLVPLSELAYKGTLPINMVPEHP